jgi:hypothetical protein
LAGPAGGSAGLPSGHGTVSLLSLLISGRVAESYRGVTTLSPDVFLARWLLITAVLFVLRLRRATKERPPATH